MLRKPTSQQKKSPPNDHAHSVQQLASLFRADNEARPVFLLGAGASFSSGVPLAADGVKRIARRVYAERIKGGSLHPHQVKLSEWQTWLHGHEWFIAGEDRLAENFPHVIEHLLNPSDSCPYPNRINGADGSSSARPRNSFPLQDELEQ